LFRGSREAVGLQGLWDVVIEANVRRWLLIGFCAGVQENEVAGAVRDQTVVAVAGGAANSASNRQPTRCGHIFFGCPIFRESLWAVGFSGGILEDWLDVCVVQ